MSRLSLLLNKITALESELSSLYQQLEMEKAEILEANTVATPNFIAIIQDEKFVSFNSRGLILLQCSYTNYITGKSTFDQSYQDLQQVVIGYSLMKLRPN